jgi:predicted component of type VI protein secretion system
VAFTGDGGEANLSVSRNHAHIGRAEGQSDYRVFDDQSVHGTSIVRNGRTIPVPPGPRGVRLQAGDEIILGEVCLRVEFAQGEPFAAPEVWVTTPGAEQ